MIKILSIGNSFSQDAQAYVHQIAASAGIETKVVNLYIGGCPLERHYNNMLENAVAYSYELNGRKMGRTVSIMEGLCEEDWDYVTMQQASPVSGLPATYYPYLDELSAYVKKYAPNAKQLIHETWAYETTTQSSAYRKTYGSDQKMMYAAVTAAYHGAAEHLGIDIIRAGELIQALRSDPMFDVNTGKYLTTRDGCHLSIPYARYADGALWVEQLCGGDIYKTSFIPEGADAYTINRIKRYVKQFVN